MAWSIKAADVFLLLLNIIGVVITVVDASTVREDSRGRYQEEGTNAVAPVIANNKIRATTNTII